MFWGRLNFSAFLLVALAMGSLSPLYAQILRSSDFKFQPVSVELGLSQCSVNVIFQDRRGFLWFGTADGLNRYDGYTFKHYKHDPGNNNSLSHNNVLSITEDRNGMLWFGTGGEGLNRFDRKSEKFTRYQNRPNDLFSLSNNYIHNLCCDALGMIWIGTYARLNAFDPETEKFVLYQHDPQNPNSLSPPYVRRIYEDRRGTLWIIAGAVLHKFDHRTGSFKQCALAPRSGPDVHNGVTKGVNRWDRATGKFLRFRHDAKNSASISYGNCTRIFSDRSGLMWFATDGSGLSKLDPRPPKFAHYRHEPDNRNSLSLDLPKSICEDRDGDLLMARITPAWIVATVAREKLSITGTIPPIPRPFPLEV